MCKALVLKKEADLFTLETESGQILSCVARKNLKKDGVFVGDRVALDADNVISKIERRKNVLIRPPLANLDKMFIVIAPIPKPDLYLVDKMILFCEINAIQPVICINKKDLGEEFCKNLSDTYKNVTKVLIMSTLDESVQKIKEEIDGVCALAGQSAVGKSSIINALSGSAVAKVDTFSKKIERGKQTTRTVSLFKFGENKYLADTAGFSKLDERLLKVKPEEIKSFYPEFTAVAHMCKYKSCQHQSDKDCAVLKAVNRGEIAKSRYENYLKLLEIVKNIKRY